jgi:wyosine [tRNA(Phe)-imidazoG37] synthetase (radical SAM superfamily)
MDAFGKAVNMKSFQQVCREHSAEEWEDRREVITQLYRNEHRTLKEVMSIMEAEYLFWAT